MRCNSIPVKTMFDCDIEGGCRAIALSHDARYLATLSAAEEQVCVFQLVLFSHYYFVRYVLQC